MKIVKHPAVFQGKILLLFIGKHTGNCKQVSLEKTVLLAKTETKLFYSWQVRYKQAKYSSIPSRKVLAWPRAAAEGIGYTLYTSTSCNYLVFTLIVSKKMAWREFLLSP